MARKKHKERKSLGTDRHNKGETGENQSRAFEKKRRYGRQ